MFNVVRFRFSDISFKNKETHTHVHHEHSIYSLRVINVRQALNIANEKESANLALLLYLNNLATTHDRCSKQCLPESVYFCYVSGKRSKQRAVHHLTRNFSPYPPRTHPMSRLHVLRLFLLPMPRRREDVSQDRPFWPSACSDRARRDYAVVIKT